MKFTTTKSNSDPAQNFSLHFRNQRGKNPAWKNPVTARRELLLSMSQVDIATRKLVQTISAVPPNSSSLFKKAVILRTKGSGWLFRTKGSVTTGLQNGYKDGSSLRSRRTRTWCIISLGHRKAGLAEGVWITWSTNFHRKILDSAYSRMKQ